MRQKVVSHEGPKTAGPASAFFLLATGNSVGVSDGKRNPFRSIDTAEIVQTRDKKASELELLQTEYEKTARGRYDVHMKKALSEHGAFWDGCLGCAAFYFATIANIDIFKTMEFGPAGNALFILGTYATSYVAGSTLIPRAEAACGTAIDLLRGKCTLSLSRSNALKKRINGLETELKPIRSELMEREKISHETYRSKEAKLY